MNYQYFSKWRNEWIDFTPTQGKVELHPMNKPGVDLEEFKEVDIAKEYEKLNNANMFNQNITDVKSRYEAREAIIGKINGNIADMKAQIAALEKELQENNVKHQSTETR